jgi:hypothetical protein
MLTSPSARALSCLTGSVIPAAARARNRFVAVAVTLSCLLLAVSADAEPFRITSGTFRFASGPANANVSGPDFSLFFGETGTDEFGIPGLALARADPFANALPLSGHVVFDSHGRFAVADGSLRDLVDLIIFDLIFEADSADTTVGPCPFPVASPGPVCTVATGPFRLTGQLTAFRAFSGEQVLQRALTGSGIATVGFLFRDFGPDPFAIFRFEPAAPTPEPGTLLLVLCGALGLSGVRYVREVAVNR